MPMMAEAGQRDTRVDHLDPKFPAGSYKKSIQAYDDIFLAGNGPAHPDRISTGASIIIVAPQSEDWREK